MAGEDSDTDVVGKSIVGEERDNDVVGIDIESCVVDESRLEDICVAELDEFLLVIVELDGADETDEDDVTAGEDEDVKVREVVVGKDKEVRLVVKPLADGKSVCTSSGSEDTELVDNTVETPLKMLTTAIRRFATRTTVSTAACGVPLTAFKFEIRLHVPLVKVKAPQLAVPEQIAPQFGRFLAMLCISSVLCGNVVLQSIWYCDPVESTYC